MKKSNEGVFRPTRARHAILKINFAWPHFEFRISKLGEFRGWKMFGCISWIIFSQNLPNIHFSLYFTGYFSS